MKKNKDKKENENKEFKFPVEMVAQIYEMSGGADSYKGIVLCICSENGTPQIYTRFDSVLTSLGLKKAMEEWLNEASTEISDDEE
jgi:hypothetical protein